MIMPLGSAYSVPDDQTMWEWAEEKIEISPRMPSAIKGEYSTDVTPYVRGIMDAFKDPAINRITIKKGAQTGISFAVYLAAAYWSKHDPDPIIIVMPSANLAQSRSEMVLQPLFQDNPELSVLMTDDPDDFKKLQYKLKRNTIYLVGANAASALASRECRVIIFDECDKFPPSVGKEADVGSLGGERTKSFRPFHKVIEISTPVNEKGQSAYISNAYNIGDQRKYIMPCPDCNGEVILDFQEHFTWDKEAYEKAKEEDPDSAIQTATDTSYIECPHCAGKIEESRRMDAINKGWWKATAVPQLKNHASFHVPGLISSFYPIQDAVSEFLIATEHNKNGFQGPLQNFVNSGLGEAWTAPPKKQVEEERVREHAAKLGYGKLTIPTDESCVIYATVDRQSAHLVYTTWAATIDSHFMIDNGYLSTLDDLPALKETVYFTPSDKEKTMSRVFLDTGYDTMNCYKYCLKYSWLIPIKGEKGSITKQTKPVHQSNIDSFPGGKLFGGKRTLKLFHIHPSFFKDELCQAIDETNTVSIYFHQDIDNDFVHQMVGEVVKETKPDRYGNTIEYYHKVHINDYFDCSQYSFAVRHLAYEDLLKMRKRHNKAAKEAEKTKA